MNRDAFKQLLKRYVSGTATEGERALIDHWFELLYNDNTTVLNDSELDTVEEEMWHKIENEARLGKAAIRPTKTPIRTVVFRWAAAAAILTGLTLGIYLSFSSETNLTVYQQSKEKNKLHEVINNSHAVKRVQLEDGTVINLNRFAKLAYPSKFAADKREVYLEGGAFFEVAKNPVKPFLVYSGNLITQVLGTSFTIAPDKKKDKITVSVKTGRVAVFEDDKHVALNNNQIKNNGIIITPNQRAVYDGNSRSFTTLLVENPQPVISEREDSVAAPLSFAFDETKLTTVLGNVGKMYAIDIMVENENIYNCLFSGNIEGQSLYEKLELICQSTNNEYEIKGTKILIKGKGCN